MSPPTGRIPEVTTAKPLTAAVALSTLVIAGMIGLYIALIGAWGFLTVRFLMALPDRLERFSVFGTVFWLCVASVAVMVLLFLVKPLIPLPRGRSKPTEITEQDQPELFAYIDGLADCTDTPRPERILIDIDANASASFQGGLFGGIGGRLTLTLGLPLAGSLTIRQFAGIVAHELGHFSQGHMIRQNALTHFVSGWLTEIALEEDIFDRMIGGLADSLPFIFGFPFRLVRLITVSIRKLLLGVMIVGHATSRLVSRQLEYDADQFMVHTAGSDHFAQTMNETVLLAHASAMTLDEVSRIYQDRRLPNNLTAMMIARARRFSPEQRSKMLKGHARSERESFSTHPLTRKRVAAAEALASEGLVQDDRPARLLFRDFDELCAKSSQDLYKEVIGEKYDPKHLTDSSLLISELDATDRAREAALRYCQSELLLAYPMFPPRSALKLPAEPKAALAEIGQLRNAAPQFRNASIPLIRKHAEAHGRLMNARQGLTIVQAGFTINDFASMGLGAGDQRGLSEEVSEHSAEVDRCESEMQSANRSLVRRIELALGLLRHAKVAKSLSERRCERMRREVKRLIPAGNALASVRNSIDDLCVHSATLRTGLSMSAQGAMSQELAARTMRAAEETRGIISDVLRILHGEGYPFAHGDGDVSIAAAMCSRPPDGDNPADIYFVAEELIGRYEEVRVRVVGRLCYQAERVEKAMGLKPLPAPEQGDALEGLVDQFATDTEQPDPGAGKIILDSIPLFGHGLAGVTVLSIAGAALFLFGGVPDMDLPSGRDRSTAASRANDRPSASSTFKPPRSPSSVPRNPGMVDRQRELVRDRDRPNIPAINTPQNEPALTVEAAIAQLSSRRSSEQQEAVDYLRRQDLNTVQQARLVEQAEQIILETRDSAMAEHALGFLEDFSEDAGFAFLTKNGPNTHSSTHAMLMKHLSHRPAAEVCPVLVAWLGTPIASHAARALQDSAYHAHAEPHLLERLGDPNESIRMQVIRLLEKVATDRAVPALELAMNDSSFHVRSRAEDILERLSPTSVDAAANFLRAAQNLDPGDVSLTAPLSRLNSQDGLDDPRLREVCTHLVQIIKNGSSTNQRLAWRALEKWADTPATAVCEPLLLNERSPRDQVRTALNVVAAQRSADAAELIVPWLMLETEAVEAALIRNGPSSEQAVLTYITNNDADVRLACVRVLGAIGGRASLSALNGRGNDRDPRVERAAREAFYAVRERLREAE
ncbi:MAG: HEAT repeat domain-containing protein [Planctomycetota bacterium]